MRWIGAAACCAAILALPLAVQAAGDVSGTWNFSGVTVLGSQPIGTLESICRLDQAGAKITGVCRGTGGDEAMDGFVTGGHITLLWHARLDTPVGPTSAVVMLTIPAEQIGDGTIGGIYEIEGVSRSRLLRLEAGHPGVDAPLRGTFSATRQ